MDNRINEIRRKIRTLRLEMLALSSAIRAQMSRDEDCCDGALRLMAMRREMLTLIERRNAMGGREECAATRRFKLAPRSLHHAKAPFERAAPAPASDLANSGGGRDDRDEKRRLVSIFQS
jgi:hypothetical protein